MTAALSEPDWAERELHDERTPLERARERLITGNAILDLPEPASLVGDLLYLDSLAVLYGPSGAGKTFLALDWALHVACGNWWHDRTVVQGPVLYVIAEGAHSLGPRVRAWMRHNQREHVGPVFWLPTAPNLLHRQEANVLVEIARDLHPALVIVDTLARCLIGGDENSAKDMGLAVTALDQIRAVTGACVMAIHHTGKDEAAGARGSSALRAAVDTELEIRGDRDNLALALRKQRNGPDGPIWRYHLEPVATVDSCVIAPQGRSTDPRTDLTSRHMLEALDALDTGAGVPNSVWRDDLVPRGVAPRTFYRRLKMLQEEGLIANRGSNARPLYALTPLGRATI